MELSKGKKILVGISIVIALLAIFIIASYNSLVRANEDVISSMANIDTMLQRRADLIPNLVSTVKDFTNHEKEVIDKVLEARETLSNANTLQAKAEADENLSKAVENLTLIVENYPELKSDTSYKALMDELAGSENRIAVARRDYNKTVQNYNNNIKIFPKNIIANIFGFEKAQYFESSEGAEENPNVEKLFD